MDSPTNHDVNINSTDQSVVSALTESTSASNSHSVASTSGSTTRDFIKVDDDGRFTLGKAAGGLGDFHDDLKSLFDTENILTASAEFFEQKISSKVEPEI